MTTFQKVAIHQVVALQKGKLHKIKRSPKQNLKSKRIWQTCPQKKSDLPHAGKCGENYLPACHYPHSLTFDTAAGIWASVWMCVCGVVWKCVCSQHSIPVSDTKHSSALCSLSPKQTPPPGSQNEYQIKHHGPRPEKAAADSYQWPCQPDDTVHTQLGAPDTKHTHIHHRGFFLVVIFVSRWSHVVHCTLVLSIEVAGAYK